jgi:hypothetical protein
LWNFASPERVFRLAAALHAPPRGIVAPLVVQQLWSTNMKILLTALAAAGLALSSGAALAQATSSLGDNFEDIDTDNNGMVSWAEFSLVFTEITEDQFNTADSDGDGFLDAEEFDSLTLETGSVDAPTAPEVVPDNRSLTYWDTDS